MAASRVNEARRPWLARADHTVGWRTSGGILAVMPIRRRGKRRYVLGLMFVLGFVLSSSAFPQSSSAAGQGCDDDSGQIRLMSDQVKGWLLRHPGREDQVTHRYDSNDVEVICVPFVRANRSARAAAAGFSQSFIGTFAFPLPRGRGSARVSEFRRGTFAKGFMQTSYVGSSSSDDTRFSGTVVLKFSARGAGSACVSFSGTAVLHQQETAGRFTFLGGTGAAARLHATGTFAAVQPMPFSTKRIARLYMKASSGSRRSLPTGCGKPPPVHIEHVTATFDGFAQTAGPPPTSATLTPSGGTITGPDCHAGGSLYGVFQYAGPSAAHWQTGVFGPTGATQERTAGVIPGRNVLLLFTGPTNGSYSSKMYIQPTGSQQLSGNTLFQPSVTINC
jgi:hypothetical protein